MRTRDRVVARFYRSSDRTHVTKIRWTQKERAEWAIDIRDAAARMRVHMERGDLRSACAALLHMESLASTGISVREHKDVRSDFMNALSDPDTRVRWFTPREQEDAITYAGLTDTKCSVCGERMRTCITCPGLMCDGCGNHMEVQS